MRQLENVLDCYAKTAGSYADAFWNELNYKPLDRLLLQRFAEENRGRGPVIDLGCGPGQTLNFLHQAGLPHLLGTDVSPAMIEIARQRNSSSICFDVADMLHLPYPAETFGGALSFYSIVHLTLYEVALAFEEVYRVLKPQSQFLLSFHAEEEKDGQSTVHRSDFFSQSVDVNFYFFEVSEVLSFAYEVGFEKVDALIRYPYKEEYHSKRAYMLLTKL